MRAPGPGMTVGMIVPGLVSGLLSCAPGAVSSDPPVTQADLRLFDYDAGAPLDIVESASREEHGVLARDITYASPKGGRVSATLLAPASGAGRRAGILVLHGMPSSRAAVLPLASDLARAGAVCLAIDAPWARADRIRQQPQPLTFTRRDRDEQIQLVIDMQRGIDLLIKQPEVDPARLAYAGISYGAAMGGLLAGVERRVKAYALIVGDGGLVSHFTGSDDAAGPLQSIPLEQREAWLRDMSPIEPIRFIRRAAPAALLMQSGRRDRLIPVADAEAWHAAASQPRQVLWYDADHGLNREARKDMAAWLSRRVGIDQDKLTSE